MASSLYLDTYLCVSQDPALHTPGQATRVALYDLTSKSLTFTGYFDIFGPYI